MVKYFRYQFCWVLLTLGLFGCDSVSQILPTQFLSQLPNSPTQPVECPDIPAGSLANPDAIDINGKNVRKTGVLKSKDNTGFIFHGKQGQQLNYRHNDGICIWIYAPDNSLISDTKLPINGRYTIQIASLQGNTTFEVEMSLSDPVAAVPTPTPTPISSPRPTPQPVVNDTRRSDFPKSSCGDPMPTNPADYPVTFYPVNVPYGDGNLQIIKTFFCRDAHPRHLLLNNEHIVQVASFTNRSRAENFAQFVNQKVSGAVVGKASVWEQP